VVVSDPMLTPDSTTCDSLAPDATCVLTGTYVVTQADVDAGQIDNTGSVTDEDVCTPTACEDPNTVPVPQNSAMTVEKTSVTTNLSAPATVTYSYLVTNTGNVTLTGISLSDDNDNDDMDCPFPTLDVGTDMTCTASHTFTQAELDANGSPTADSGVLYNIVTASSNEAEDATDSLEIQIVYGPAMTVEKTSVTTNLSAPATVTYSYLVTNTGNVTLTGISLSDDNDNDDMDCPFTTLDVGTDMTCTASHTFTQAELDANGSPTADSGVLYNIVTASSNEAEDATDFLSIPINRPPGALQVTKQVEWSGTTPNPTQTFEICISGPSYPSEPSCVDLGDGESATWLELEPGEYTVTETDPGADWTVSGSGQVVVVAAGQTATATVTNTYQNPVVGIAKRAVSVTKVDIGTWEVHYSFFVENLGNVALSNLQVTDDLSITFPLPTTFSVQSISSTEFDANNTYNGDGDTNLLAGTDTLAVGASGTINLVVQVVPTEDGPFNNTATVTAQDPTGASVSDISDDGVDPDPNGNGDPTEQGENDLTPVSFGPNLFDPPFGIKTVDPSGLPLLRWTMAWINDSNIAALDAEVSDSIPFGTTFSATGASSGYPLPGGVLPAGTTNIGVSCTPGPGSIETTTTFCYYEGPTTTYPRGRIIWQGTLGPDFGATNTDEADNEMVIVFNVDVNSGITSAENVATISADLNGDGEIAGNEIDVASAQAVWRAAQVTTLPETGFAPGVQTILPPQPVQKAYQSYGDVWLEVPSLGLRTSIAGVPAVEGEWDVSWLNTQAGWLQGTAFPSFSGNSVLTGHVYLANGEPGPFVNLSKLGWNNTIVVHAFGMRYIYQVRSNQIILPDDLSAIQHEETPWLSLLTCRGYDEATGTYDFRVLVRAVLVDIEADYTGFENVR